jgi:hypothetical protein
MRPAAKPSLPRDDRNFGQVLQFPQRRAGLLGAATGATQVSDLHTEATDDVVRYERDNPADYRHRALMNLIAVAIVTLLIAAGVWIADTIAGIDRDRDCILQGRINCAPIVLNRQ